MADLSTLVTNLLSTKPDIRNNPNAMGFLNVIKNNDEKQGTMIADNLCKSMGLSREEAIRQAKTFFHIPM